MPQAGSALAPSEFQLFPYGEVWIEGSDPFLVDESAMNQAVSAFNARGLDLVVDYEHQTEGGDYSSPDGTAPAAGWIKALENRGTDGLWARVEWTQKAAELLSNKEYRYYSPVFLVSKGARRLVELLRVALTNAPRLNWIKPIIAKNPNPTEGEQMEFLKLITKKLGMSEAATQEEVLAKIERIQGADFIKLSASACGLPETSTEEQVIAALKGFRKAGEIVACKDVLTALDVPETANRSEVVATIHALKQRPDAALAAEVASLKERLAGRERDELVAGALKAGKITPAQREWAEDYAGRDPDGFRVFVAKAPQVVPTGTVSILPDRKSSGVSDDAQLQINKLMGVTDEVWKKYGPKTEA